MTFPNGPVHHGDNGRSGSNEENYRVIVCVELIFKHGLEFAEAVALTWKYVGKITDAFIKRNDPGKVAAGAAAWWERRGRPKLPLPEYHREPVEQADSEPTAEQIDLFESERD
jgi:hypothetical protein